MGEASTTQLIVDRILGGEAPLAIRAAAARGALPLPRVVLTRLAIHLLNDPEPQIQRDAEANLAAMGDPEIREVLSDESCAPEVLAHFAQKAVRDEGLAELVVFHRSVPDSALFVLGGKGNASIIELVLTNQERLLATPKLLDILTVNPALRPDQRGRILDLLDRFLKSGVEKGDQQGESDAGGEEPDLEETARLLDVDVGELFASSEILDGEEFELAEDPEIRSAYRRILTLNTAQKAMLAMRGGREERLILVRDSNKVVALCVLRNPRLNDQEVEMLAHMRNVTDEVLRTIATHREWVKNYSVVSALVRNPKTPPGVSTNFIPRLNSFDLKNLMRDKNVPEIIRKMAKKTFDIRNQRSSTRFRRG
jgi:hypothetical protein